jgi:hypothetical protein
MMKRWLVLGALLAGCASPGDEPGPDGSTSLPGSSVEEDDAITGSGIGGGNGGGGSTTSFAARLPAPGAVPRIARLTHFQWTNSVQDLLRLDEPPTVAGNFTPDAIIGFDTNSAQLRMSNALREDYERAAERLASQVVSDPAALARLLPTDAPVEPTARARAFIEDFGLRAYRRPLTAEEVSQYLTLFESAPELAPELDAFSAGVMLSIRLFLQSPFFLYRTELGQEADDRGRVALDGYEVAAKLALAVTGSIPDDALLAAAAAGELDPGSSQTTVGRELDRLMATPRVKATSLHAHAQILALSRYSLIQKDVVDYPEFTPTTPSSIRASAELFLGTLYEEDLGIRSLLTSTEAFVDANLAPLYGIPGTFGSELERVDLSGLPRKGFLTQVGFLALFAGEHQPDPIHRGVFINQQLLCVDISPPPNIVLPPIPENQPSQTNRQAIEAINGRGTCGQACHATIINPAGFAFEHYDPLGRYRTTDSGLEVDASDVFQLDGGEVEFSDAMEFVELLANSQMAHHCYTRNLLSYLNGHLADSSDADTLAALAARSKGEDLSTKDLIRSLVQSESFLTRLAAEEP